MLRLCEHFLCIATLVGLAFSQVQTPTQSEIMGATRLPSAYGGLAEMTRGDDPSIRFRFRFAIGDEWTSATQMKVLPEGLEVPILHEYATELESWYYTLGEYERATRNKRFTLSRRMAIEQSLSPLPALRDVKSDDENVNAQIEEDDLHWVLHIDSEYGRRERIYFEKSTGRPVKQVSLDRAGTIATIQEFLDWRPVGDGEVPHTIRLIPPGENGHEMRTTIVITESNPLDESTPPQRMTFGPDVLIIDEIENVTRRADGTVLGPIEQGTAASPSSQSQGPGPTGLSSRTVVAIGVGLVLLAAAAIGYRRWKGA